MTRTINPGEIRQFQKDSAHWWDESGPFAPLHRVNPVRMEFMVGVLEQHAPHLLNNPKTWTHLDVGCGGGLVAEPFARLGARVTGLDADPQAIAVAQAHSTAAGLDIAYRVESIEEFRQNCHPGTGRDSGVTRSRPAPGRHSVFDTITALEIIEHVDAPDLFLDEIAACSAPGGIVFISTLNRTLKSLAFGVVAAEYVLGWVPRGTHDWRKFMRPSDLAARLRARNFTPIAASGITYAPLRGAFTLSPHDLDVNYIMAFRRT